MKEKSFSHKLAGLSSIYCAGAYILGILYFLVFTNYLTLTDSISKIQFLIENQFTLYFIYLVIYIIFGIAIMLLTLDFKSKLKDSVLTQLMSLFGFFWAFAVIIAGMLHNVGMFSIIEIASTNMNLAIVSWTTLDIVFNALGGGSELLGGIWILLLSIICLKEKVLSKHLHYLGIGIGICGILSDLPYLEIFQMIFGLTQIVWFMLLGICLLRNNK